MRRKLRIAYFAHTIRSDWNNGNAHFLRGLLRALNQLGHEVTAFEPDSEWSLDNLLTEPSGEQSLAQFAETYPDLDIQTYAPQRPGTTEWTDALWHEHLRGTQIVILHEWNPPALAAHLLSLRDKLGFKLLFHDTHHRASSSPEAFSTLRLARFDAVLAFGEALTSIYRERFHVERVHTFHEAADTSVFRPLPETEKANDIVWIGNWGEGERSAEIRDYLLKPIRTLQPVRSTIYGVRYPAEGLEALREAGTTYGGYLPNLSAPAVYAASRLTAHVPRQQYSAVMAGIPTIRVFEALACGIPLISAPWQDTEHLFRRGDFLWASTTAEMMSAMRHLLSNPEEAAEQALRGRETVLARHTCRHRAEQLTTICEELLS